MLQPYLERVDTHGETALIYFEGRFSHAIRKVQCCGRGSSPRISCSPRRRSHRACPTPEELAVGEQAVRAIPFGRLLYARVDLIRDDADRPCVLELELTEPSVYLLHAGDRPSDSPR